MDSLETCGVPSWEERERLAVLSKFGILDTPPEPEFDEIVQLASKICEAPISLVSLVEEKRQWFKAKVGIKVTETPLDVSICKYGILQPELLIISDTRDDSRFQNNPLVTGDLNLRFYAGAPIQTSAGLPMGMLCVIDHKPRDLNDFQKDCLKMLSRQVMHFMELHRSNLIQTHVIDYLRQAEESHDLAMEVNKMGTWDWDIENDKVYGDRAYSKLLNLPEDLVAAGLPAECIRQNIYEPDQATVLLRLEEAFETKNLYKAKYRVVTSDGKTQWVFSRAKCYFKDDKPVRLVGCSYNLRDLLSIGS